MCNYVSVSWLLGMKSGTGAMMIVEAVDSYLNNSECVTGSVIKQREPDPSCQLLFYVDFFFSFLPSCLSKDLRSLKAGTEEGVQNQIYRSAACLASPLRWSFSLNKYYCGDGK